MDRKFHTDDFERLLREKSEEFRMYPSKRIWYSIYNNIHPSRRWPSVAMSITLITALLLMGYLNTNNTNSYSSVSGKNTFQQKTIAQTKSPQLASKIPADHPINSTTIVTITNNQKVTAPYNNLNNNLNNKTGPKSSPSTVLSIDRQDSISDVMDSKNGVASFNKPTKKQTFNPFVTVINSLHGLNVEQTGTASDYGTTQQGDDQSEALTYAQKTGNTFNLETSFSNDFIPHNNSITATIHGGNSVVDRNKLVTNNNYLISGEDKDWIENYALYNRPAPKKWANKLGWQMYATPSVVYRILYNDPNFGNTLNATPFAISPSNQDINNAVNQKPSIGLEIGTGLQYSIFKGVKIKAGLQLNYTRYNSNAFQNTHPVSTKLTMHDYKTNISYEEYRTTPYSNKSGLESVKLHNQTFQVSLPIGADIKLMGKENLQWNLGVTIQPTYVAWGKSYLISSDRRNYVMETSMINKWNLNAGFETFMTFKYNGLTYQVGPQFRTQLFSTNTKKFAVEERLFNFGLKFGIIKTLK